MSTNDTCHACNRTLDMPAYRQSHLPTDVPKKSLMVQRTISTVKSFTLSLMSMQAVLRSVSVLIVLSIFAYVTFGIYCIGKLFDAKYPHLFCGNDEPIYWLDGFLLHTIVLVSLGIGAFIIWLLVASSNSIYSNLKNRFAK